MIANWRLAVVLSLLAFSFLLLGAGSDDLSNSYERLKNLSVTEREELLRKQQQFSSLEESEQQRLRRLHKSIEDSTDGERLKDVMIRYHQWLKTLPGEERANLLKLPPEERISQIKILMQRQQDERFRDLVRTPLESSDVRAIFGWIDRYVEKHEAELLATLPGDAEARLQRIDSEQMRRQMLLMALGRRREGTQLPPPDEGDLTRLEQTLTPKARQALAKVSSRDQKMILVQEWVKAAVFSRFVPQVSNERLLAFYRENRDELNRRSPKMVEKIDSLPQELFYAELKKLYFEKRARERNDHSGSGFSRGNRPWFRHSHDGDRPSGRDGRSHDSHDSRRNRPDGPRRGGPPNGPPPQVPPRDFLENEERIRPPRD